MTLAKLDDLGERTVDEMEAKTIYTPRYKGNTLGVYNEKVCGGDCFEFTQKYIDMYFIQANTDKTGTWSYKRYEARPCKAEDLTLEEF